MGQKISQFDWPVCDKFKPILLEGQLCYQVDVNEVMKQGKGKTSMKDGLIVMMDYNEDKMVIQDRDVMNIYSNDVVYDTLKKDDKSHGARIYFDTLGKYKKLLECCLFYIFF